MERLKHPRNRNVEQNAQIYVSPFIRNMDAFDRLPRKFRDILNNAVINWSASQVYEAMMCGHSHEFIEKGMRQEDASRANERYMQLERGEPI